MRSLIVVPQQDRISGNWVTAMRFKQGLENLGAEVSLHDILLHDDPDIEEAIRKADPEIAILLHAYRSGKPWLENKICRDIPYVVVLTGTDINQGLKDSTQRQIILAVLKKAKLIVLHNSLLANQLAQEYPLMTTKIRQLSPGIVLGTAPYSLRGKHGLDETKALFLCPAGVRPVKGVLELLEMFDKVVAKNPACQLAFCGPILDKSYAEDFLKGVEQRPWAHYLGAIPTDAMAEAMRGADVILNNSRAEGLANSLLEAATLGIPILANNIPGNATVVKDGENGLRYNNEAEFTRYALQLCNKQERQKLSRPCSNLYNPEQEAAKLKKILHEVLETK